MNKSTGVKRIVNAAGYSYKGLAYTFKHEAAFRQELICALLLVPLAFWLDVSTVERLLMILCLFIVLIVELINSAIEAVVDRVGEENHVLSGAAKDIGSAAVTVALVACVFVWATILSELLVK